MSIGNVICKRYVLSHSTAYHHNFHNNLAMLPEDYIADARGCKGKELEAKLCA